jgi:hypothetical protein
VEKFTSPAQSINAFAPIAREYNRNQGTHLPAAHAAVRTLTEILEHPVKSLMCGSVERQDQLAPSDMLPVKAQFDNTRQD